MSHTDVSIPASAAPSTIERGAAHLGIELGSTRIKAALIDGSGNLLASGSHAWENERVDDNWTYSLDDVWSGLADCVADLRRAVLEAHHVELTEVASLGVSAMMHGYLAFDASGEQLVPFRTWRNTYTADASTLLSTALERNIPLRWSVAHLAHAILGEEEHVGRISFITTLAGYVHWKLSGQKAIGVGDASGMFPIDSETCDYDAAKLETFNRLDIAAKLPASLCELLPKVLVAGQDAGSLTEEGARLLDPSGKLLPGAVMAPPEGDAGTGMVATNSVAPRTGNVSAGTSAFAMVVLDRALSGPREEIDLVTTPSGEAVAMIHTNNCTGDLDQWLRLFADFAGLGDSPMGQTELYRMLFEQGALGDADAGGIVSYNYLSGEHQTGVASGRPLLVRNQQARFSLPNFMRAQLYGAFGALAHGMKVLLDEEGVSLATMYAHGGIFRTQDVAQQVLADALDVPVAVAGSAGEGGAWGMAVLAAYTAGGISEQSPSLTEYLADDIFAELELHTLEPDSAGARGYEQWLEQYRAGLPVERLAGETLR